MQMLWSAKNNAFIPESMREQYINNGWDLSDCARVDGAVSGEFMGEAPLNKMRVAGEDGMPAWADMPVEVIPLESAQS